MIRLINLLETIFPRDNPLTPAHAVGLGLMFIIVVVSYWNIRLNKRLSDSLATHEAAEQGRQKSFETHKKSVRQFYEDSKEYFDRAGKTLDLVNRILELARANTSDAREIARVTATAVSHNREELEKLAQQAAENARIVKEASRQLEETIPDKTVEKMREIGLSDTGSGFGQSVVRTVSEKPPEAGVPPTN